jgi:hypothetical protein
VIETDYTAQKKWWCLRSLQGIRLDENDQPWLFPSKGEAMNEAIGGEVAEEVVLQLHGKKAEKDKLQKSVQRVHSTINEIWLRIGKIEAVLNEPD